MKVHLYFNETETAILLARALSECRSCSQLAKSAVLFYAKHGPWKLANEDLDKNKRLLTMADKMKLEGK